MINWYGLFTNSLWILGAALVLAALSWRFYATSLPAGQRRDATLATSLGLMLFALGLALQRHTPLWQSAIWFLLAGAFAGNAWLARRERRGDETDLGAILRRQLSGPTGIALGLILIGVLLASLYAVTIRPWMQPDEPRHYEVALHDARLGRPGAGYDDVNLDWEREIIADMEAQDFWWYGYSVNGWDPERLPDSFETIWEPRYSRAFFQLPLYYDLAGLLLYTWGDDLTMSQSVILLRFFGIFWLALSLGGIYALGRELFPKHPQIALAALAFAALWPSHLTANAAVNNDPMAETLVIWSMFWAVRILRRGPDLRSLTWFSLFLLLAIYTKRTSFSVFSLLMIFPAWGVLQWRQRSARRARIIGAGVLVAGLLAIPALFLLMQATGRYWLPTSLLSQATPAHLWALISAAPIDRFMMSLYRTFWGWFGWLRLPLPQPLYAIGLIVTAVMAALVLLGYAQIANKKLRGWQKAALVILLLMLISQITLTLGKDIIYGDWENGSVPQMRYLYPVLPALLLPMMLGAQRILPRGWRPWALPALILTLLTFNLYILAFIVYPFFWL